MDRLFSSERYKGTGVNAFKFRHPNVIIKKCNNNNDNNNTHAMPLLKGFYCSPECILLKQNLLEHNPS